MIDPVLIVALVAIGALTVAPVIQNRRREHKLDAVLASLGEIMANQETLNELAGQLSSAATALTSLVPELTAAVNAEESPLDFSAVQSATSEITAGVAALTQLVATAPEPSPEV